MKHFKLYPAFTDRLPRLTAKKQNTAAKNQPVRKSQDQNAGWAAKLLRLVGRTRQDESETSSDSTESDASDETERSIADASRRKAGAKQRRVSTLTDEQADALIKEVTAFAVYLGMDPEEDEEFLWIAVEAMIAPLPKNWSEHEARDGRVYFYNRRTDHTQWEHPMDEYHRSLYRRLKDQKLKMLAERHSLGDASISSIEIGWNSSKKRSPLDYLAERRQSISGSSGVSRSTDWDSRFEFEPTRFPSIFVDSSGRRHNDALNQPQTKEVEKKSRKKLGKERRSKPRGEMTGKEKKAKIKEILSGMRTGSNSLDLKRDKLERDEGAGVEENNRESNELPRSKAAQHLEPLALERDPSQELPPVVDPWLPASWETSFEASDSPGTRAAKFSPGAAGEITPSPLSAISPVSYDYHPHRFYEPPAAGRTSVDSTDAERSRESPGVGSTASRPGSRFSTSPMPDEEEEGETLGTPMAGMKLEEDRGEQSMEETAELAMGSAENDEVTPDSKDKPRSARPSRPLKGPNRKVQPGLVHDRIEQFEKLQEAGERQEGEEQP